jgi:hypothetical protein
VTITRQVKCDNHEWIDVIRDAESEIDAMRKKISRLRASIRLFKERMESGDALPSDLKRLKATE